MLYLFLFLFASNFKIESETATMYDPIWAPDSDILI